MPKNKFQDVIFTAIMATIMGYGRLQCSLKYRWCDRCYLRHGTARAADHGADCIYPGILYCRKACKDAGIHRCPSDRQTAGDHLCDFHLHLLHYVSDNEPDRYIPV